MTDQRELTIFARIWEPPTQARDESARLLGEPAMLSELFDTDQQHLAGQPVSDPRAAVAHDVAALRDDPRVSGVRVSGLVYDVATGRTETVVAP